MIGLPSTPIPAACDSSPLPGSGGGRIAVRRAVSEPIDPGLGWDDAEKFGGFLKAALRKHNLQASAAVCVVGRERVFLHSLAIPASPEDQVANLVRFQLAQELPFAIEESVVDYVITARRDDGKVTGVLAAAVRTEVITALQLAFRAAGVALRRVGLRPFANLLALGDHPESAGQNALFVDLGPQGLEIDLFSAQGTLDFSRNIGLDELPSKTTPLKEAYLERAILQLNRTLQAQNYTAASSPAARPQTVLVAGSTGWENDFAAQVTAQLSLPARLLELPGDAAGQTAFATCYGMARGHVLPQQDQFNFLTPKRAVDPQAVRSRYYRLAVGGIAALVILGFIYSHSRVAKRKTELNGLIETRNKLNEEYKSFQKFEAQMKQVQAWQDKRVNWLDQLKLLSTLLPPNDRVYLSNTVLAGSDKEDVFVDISLSGQAKSRQDIDKIAQTLNDQGNFKVTLGQQSTVGDAYPESFKLTLMGRKPPAEAGKATSTATAPSTSRPPVPPGARTDPAARPGSASTPNTRRARHE